jgi:hypothetical protein
MKVEVLYFEGCPNHAATVAAVREALKAERRSVEVQEVEVRTPEEAESLGFLGSPTVRIDGLDIEPEARTSKSYGSGCRTYVEGSARTGAPSVDLIRRAVNEVREEPDPHGFDLHHPCCNTNIEALSISIVECFPQLNSLEQRLSLELYRLLAAGRPVPRSSLAEKLGEPVESVNRILESWPGVFSDL